MCMPYFDKGQCKLFGVPSTKVRAYSGVSWKPLESIHRQGFGGLWGPDGVCVVN